MGARSRLGSFGESAYAVKSLQHGYDPHHVWLRTNMINGPLDGSTDGTFLLLFAITGGSGQYVGAKGAATIDPTLDLQY